MIEGLIPGIFINYTQIIIFFEKAALWKVFSFHISVHYRIRYNVLDYHSSLFVVLPYAHCTIIIVGLALREGVDENI